MPNVDDGTEVRVLVIKVGTDINASLYQCTSGDSIEEIGNPVSEPLDIENDRENIESLVSLVGIVTAIYHQRQSNLLGADTTDLSETDLRDQLNGLIKVLGRQLYRVLFRGQIHVMVVENLKRNLKLLRIQLEFTRQDDGLERWPWEYLYIPKEAGFPAADRFLALITQLTLNRRMVVATPRVKLTVAGRMNILFVVSSPPQRSPGARVREDRDDPNVDASAIGALRLVEREAAWVNDQNDDVELVAPAILPFEVGNKYWKRLRRSASEARSVMAIWTVSLPVRLVQPDPLCLAHETGLTFYDASYLRLTHEHDADLVSLDAQLVCIARRFGTNGADTSHHAAFAQLIDLLG